MNEPSLQLSIHPLTVRLRANTGLVVALACLLLRPVAAADAQITVNSKTGTVTNESTSSTTATVDRRYRQITPTKVPLSKTELDPKTRLELIRLLEAEQGFAMRPFPRGHRGLLLEANGNLEPAGEKYFDMVTAEGLSAKPGDRLVLTNIKIEHSRIVIDLNGGPDPKHRFLRHIQLGTGPEVMGPVVQDNDAEPVGARLSLAFKEHVPEITATEVKALLAPMISFDLKTPVQAFTDTLPAKLKDAILNHKVLVGMSTEMVIFAKGAPDTKSRELEGQMPFEEWIYGKPPKDVEFVRINGNRVIRLEVAKMGETPMIFTKDEVEGLMRTDGTPLDPELTPRVAKAGDVERDPDTQANTAPPTLRKPDDTGPVGTLNTDIDPTGRVGVMRPVQFPKPKPKDDPNAQPASPPAQQPGANPDGEAPPAAQAPEGVQTPPADASEPGPAKPQPAPPAGAGQPNQLRSSVPSLL